MSLSPMSQPRLSANSRPKIDQSFASRSKTVISRDERAEAVVYGVRDESTDTSHAVHDSFKGQVAEFRTLAEASSWLRKTF